MRRNLRAVEPADATPPKSLDEMQEFGNDRAREIRKLTHAALVASTNVPHAFVPQIKPQHLRGMAYAAREAAQRWLDLEQVIVELDTEIRKAGVKR